ncbi:DUF3011 domain-containing protein [Pseudoxanthomonas sp. PXM02]|uniref:DUF3011 domain-containing protein n=1 Tax=Pseudoxanthomonas sp. PXM02 TaxID=2769294 RepID=UPI001780F9D3|nr:DUF3011 domain-containing protein [Pseudoxanthomonas sp. PXM02]MBD9480379.1 DUF3011 domain-containing protein [Pseudoxanthomonas sp. PXM02]
MDCTRTLLYACLAGAGLWGFEARADDTVTCESRNDRYQSCPLVTAGYVTLERQLSGTACTQGRTWDYTRREIWVDDGCRASFRVHTSSSGHHDSDHDAKVAAGMLIGAAILGAIASNAHKKDDKYDDDRYQGARHTSYVPSWMIGTFEGYNALYDADVSLTIESGGRATARSRGQTINGWINDGRLNVGDTTFDIDQSREGLVTSQVGDRQNEVRYRRVR